MPRSTRYYLLFILSFINQLLFAQPAAEGKILPQTDSSSSSSYRIGQIHISGNDRTRGEIILRELPFREGEAYSPVTLVEKIADARRQLMNTTLFHSVEITMLATSPATADITVKVKERWYLFPVPFVKPVDRNLNQWLFEKDASLNRVNYGIKLLYNNATGRNDKFRLWLVSGYTRQLSFSYDRLYIDRGMHWGLNTGFAYGKTRELNYNTVGDKQVFLKQDDYVRRFLYAGIGLTYRRAIRTRHHFGVNFTAEQVSDTIVQLNPAYFTKGRNQIGFPTLYYTMDYFNLDYIPYPTRGIALRLSVSKSGLNNTINLWQLHAKASLYQPLSPKTFVQGSIYGGIKLPFNQPWFSRRFLGYGDTYLQGYEYYVVDGVAGGFLKATMAHQLMHFNFGRSVSKNNKPRERIPLRIYGKVFANAGYVYDPRPGDNELSNKLLLSCGIGLDILTIYDLTFRVEWSFNQLGQNGLFLHPKTIF